MKMPTLTEAVEILGATVNTAEKTWNYNIEAYVDVIGGEFLIDGRLPINQLKAFVVLAEEYPWILD